MNKHREFLLENPECDPAERAVRRELDRLGIENEPFPEECPTCHGTDFKESGGFAGETIVYCAKGCGVLWEDSEGAIRSVF